MEKLGNKSLEKEAKHIAIKQTTIVKMKIQKAQKICHKTKAYVWGL